MPIHQEQSPLAGKTVRLKDSVDHPHIPAGERDYRVEDWWDCVDGRSWMDAVGNPAALIYAVRSVRAGLPIDNDVLYGKVGPFGHLIHVSEIVEG